MGILKDVVDLDDYKRELKAHYGKLMVIDFHASWCPPCREIAPAVKSLADKHDIVIIKIDVDKAEEVTREERISAMPTFKFYKNGLKMEEFEGANRAKLESVIGKYK